MGFTVWIASLYHKFLDNPMEQYSFIGIILTQLNKVIPMQRCIIIKHNGYISHVCRNRYINRFPFFQLFRTASSHDKQQGKQC